MKNPTLRLICAVLFCLAQAALLAQEQTRGLATVQKIIEGEWQALETPGLSIAVGISNRVAWEAGFGFANLEKKTPARPETIYRYASISKPIAATAVMQLVEAGKINLDATLQTYLPTFPNKPEGIITIRHLLTHTAGIRHYDGPLEVLSNRRYDTITEALTIFQDDALKSKPGTAYLYSSYGYNALGAVIEAASNAKFRDHLKARIFVPAGMNSTDLEVLEEPSTNRCVQYIKAGSLYLPAPKVDLSNKWAGGGMVGTAPDLVRFCLALDQAKLLQPATRAQMYRPMVLADQSQTKYGLGWNLRSDAQKRFWAAHSGGATGGTTYLIHSPQHRISVAILCNRQGVKGLDELAMRLGQALLPTDHSEPPL